MKEFDRILVTSALPYANGPLHIGHLAGAYLSADIYVRFMRMMEKDVLFVCGSDENGAAITIRAKKDRVEPQSIVDKYHQQFQDTFKEMGLSFDVYHRTSSKLHHETAQEFFRDLHQKGEFVEKETEQYYDVTANQFLADRYIMGQCPKCEHEEAYGDQCENCGSSLSPTELINPRSTISGNIPQLKKTTHWYLPLDKYEDWLKEWVNNGKVNGEQLHEPSEWKNHVLGQCKSWLEGGLNPRSMTRDLNWGVDVPQEIEGAEGKKLYVWLDAPIGYISATKQWAADNEKEWEPYWKDSKTKMVHFIGKDNIVFHCIIFPAILKAHGEYILPENVPANQFMNLEGRKISTSKNYAVWVHEYLKDFPDRQDELRYYMIKAMPEQKDSEFTWKGFQDANNNELVNNLANFVNRVIVLTNKYYDGVIPEFNPDLDFESAGEDGLPGFHDGELLELFDMLHDLSQYIREYNFREALKMVMAISTRGNQLLQFNEPWKLVKDEENADKVKTIMNLALQHVAALRIACRPFLPFTSDRLSELLGLPEIEEKDEFLIMQDNLAEGFPLIEAGHKVGKPFHLFSRLDDKAIEGQLNKLKEMSFEEDKSKKQAPSKKKETKSSTIVFDDFTKLDLRTATILAAEKVKKADKLLKLELDLGSEKRTVVSGIAEHYSTEEVIGKQVSMVTNLEPRKIRGVLSQGMILMAENEEGKLCFVSPEKSWDNGSLIR
jgi:methionyl-tRNA synthetase